MLLDNAVALLHSTRDYITLTEHLPEETLGGYFLDIANSSRWVLREYFLEENDKDLMKDFGDIDTQRILQVITVIDEIIELEEDAREIYADREQRNNEMVKVLHPKLMKLAELTILQK